MSKTYQACVSSFDSLVKFVSIIVIELNIDYLVRY